MTTQQRLGIIAGAGLLPSAIIQSCSEQKRDFFILALEGFTDKGLVDGYQHAWVRLGAVGKAFDILHRENISEIIMAGRLHRPSLQELRPDMRGMAFFAKMGMKALGDDGLLQAVSAEMESEGFKIVGAHEICQDLLAPEGALGKYQPRKQHWSDIKHAWKIAEVLGRVDVGQAVVVQEGFVLGVEAVEGTDALIKRTTELKRKGSNPVLVKRCKPQQNDKIDMPTIGLDTIKNAIDAGFSGIAIEAGKTLFLEQEKAIALADKSGLFLYGISSKDLL